jgi:glycosyltransferase involved in cell wall biosynthesis
VEPAEVRDPGDRPWRPDPGGGRLVWAGRLVAGKGLEALIDAVASDPHITLEVLGDGPESARLRDFANARGAGDRVRWAGRVADRVAYLERLAAADAFVFPSPAEGFPKVVLDAFAVGLPVLATRVGALQELADARLLAPIARSDPAAILAAWSDLLAGDPATIDEMRKRASTFAADHTRPAEAARLVARWRTWWPDLPWVR